MGSNPISGTIYGSVAELVYASASSTGIERYEGSSPSTVTNKKYPTGSGTRMREMKVYGIAVSKLKGEKYALYNYRIKAS